MIDELIRCDQTMTKLRMTWAGQGHAFIVASFRPSDDAPKTASESWIDEAITWGRKASELGPQEPQYAYPLAFYLNLKGGSGAAVVVLNEVIVKYPAFADAYMLLGEIYEKQGNKSEGGKVCIWPLAAEGIPDRYKHRIAEQLDSQKCEGTDVGK